MTRLFSTRKNFHSLIYSIYDIYLYIYLFIFAECCGEDAFSSSRSRELSQLPANCRSLPGIVRHQTLRWRYFYHRR